MTDAGEELRDLIDQLAKRNDLEHNAGRIREFMLRACDMIEPTASRAYSDVLKLAHLIPSAGCSDAEVVAARVLCSMEIDANRTSNPAHEAAFRAVRFLLHQHADPAPDWFEVLWAFVDLAEQAGVEDHDLLMMFRTAIPAGDPTQDKPRK